MPGAIGTAVDLALGLDAVADHPAFAVGASGGHGVDGAFEAVERHRPVALGNAERLVIVVAAHITLSHGNAPVQAWSSTAKRPVTAWVPRSQPALFLGP